MDASPEKQYVLRSGRKYPERSESSKQHESSKQPEASKQPKLATLPQRYQPPPVVDPRRIPEFEEFNRIISGLKLSFNETSQRIMRRWPDDKKARGMFLTWQIQSRAVYHHLNPQLLAPAEYWFFLKKVKFIDEASVAAFNSMVELGRFPLIPIGESRFAGRLNGYCIKPGRVFLAPNYEDTSGEGSSRLVADKGILGINEEITVPAFGPGDKPTLSGYGKKDEVVASKTSDGDSTTGFVFAQLGALCVYDGKDCDGMPNWKGASDQEIREGPWIQTGYVVVLRLDKRGKRCGVYIIWNFFDEDPETGERYHAQTTDGKDPLPEICRLHNGCSDDHRFSVAVIAPDISSLGSNRHLFIHPQIMGVRECQLVRAVTAKDKKENDMFLRQFLTRPKAPSAPKGDVAAKKK